MQIKTARIKGKQRIRSNSSQNDTAISQAFAGASPGTPPKTESIAEPLGTPEPQAAG